ncbi:MAG: RNA-binding S4 domain-containing protein [Flavobacteriales bacterium]
MRIDKFLWAVRLFKTRSLATAAVREGKVEVGAESVKASREVKPGDRVSVRRGPITYEVEVLALPKSRMGPRLVEDYIKDVTPEEELNKLEMIRLERQMAPPMKGRPTKRNRREWKKWME